MNSYSVQQYFEMHPHLKEAFETYDGVIHPTKTVAIKWVDRHSNQAITTHVNDKYNAELNEAAKELVDSIFEADLNDAGVKMIKHIVTEQDLVNNPELAEQGINVGDEIEIPESDDDDEEEYEQH